MMKNFKKMLFVNLLFSSSVFAEDSSSVINPNGSVINPNDPVYKSKGKYDLNAIYKLKGDYSNSEYKLLIDREQIYPAALEMIRSAKEEILFNMYLFGESANLTQGKDYVGIGKAVVDLLEEKQKQGVRVRVITPNPISKGLRKKLTEKGLKAEDKAVMEYLNNFDEKSAAPYVEPKYRPMYEECIKRGIRTLASNTKILTGGTKFKVDHGKLLIIDSKEAMFGGMNFAETVASNHDLMLVARGPVVDELKRIYANNWYYALQLEAPVLHGHFIEKLKNEARNLGPSSPTPAISTVSSGFFGGDVKITVTAPYEKSTRAPLLEMINKATKGEEINIEMLLFTQKDILKALHKAAQRGVKIRVLLDPNESLYGFNFGGFPNIIAVRKLTMPNVEIRKYKVDPGQELHSKFLLLKHTDGSMEFGTGSTNFTTSGLDVHYEVFAFFKNAPELSKQLSDMFEKDWNERGIPFDVSLSKKIFEPVVDMFDQTLF